MPGQKVSLKWWSSTSLFLRGTWVGSLEVVTGSLVDQARVWAEPQATLLIFLFWRLATSLGRCMALVVPSPSWPSSLSPQVKTSPPSVQATQWRDPVAILITFLPCRAATFLGLLT